MTKQTRHLIISGHVQGVSYRAWSVQTAKAMGITGWVRNLSDGNVEAIIQGSPESIRDFIGACYDGPTFARVSGIDITDLADAEIFTDFEFRETA